jgi:cell division protein FtsB
MTRKKNRNNLLVKWFLILFAIICLGGLIFLNLKMHFQRSRLKSDLQSLKSYLETTERQNQDLQARITEGNLNEFIEQITRDDLNLQKEGEQVIAFPAKQAASSSYATSTAKKKNFWQTIFDDSK